MGRPFSQQPGPLLVAELAAVVVPPPAAPTGVLAPPVVVLLPPPAVVAVVAVDEGDNAPGLNAPADDIAGEVAVVG